jgi:hypothetical protein
LKAAGTEIFIGGGQRGIHIHDWLLSLFHESRIYEYGFVVVKKKKRHTSSSWNNTKSRDRIYLSHNFIIFCITSKFMTMLNNVSKTL